MKACIECGKEVIGRVDKIFCSTYCKSAYHNQINKEKPKGLFRKIDDQLKKNRRLLKLYNKAGKAVVRKENLLKDGFNPKYFTHYWKNRQGGIYLFCYEFGFMEKRENDKTKYVLVQWQDYMEHNN